MQQTMLQIYSQFSTNSTDLDLKTDALDCLETWRCEPCCEGPGLQGTNTAPAVSGTPEKRLVAAGDDDFW